MSDFPQHGGLPLFIHPWTQFFLGVEGRQTGGVNAAVSFTWGTGNTAVYMPFAIPWPYPVRRMFWINGSTIGSNVDAGIYSEGGQLLFSTGSTAQSGTSVIQYQAPTTVGLLNPGRYYLAYVCSGTTNRSFGILSNAASGKLYGFLSQASALPLPASATFATYAGVGMPVAGFTKNASGF